MALGRLVVRSTIGALLVGHGLQKLTGSFGGHGIEGTGQFLESVGLRPGRRQAVMAGTAETAGGAMLILGFQTPLAIAAISGVMFTAIRTVHLKNGPWAANGGYEYNAVILAAVAALAETGPGPISVDALRGRERRGTRWAIAALGAGAIGSALAMRLSHRQEQPAPRPLDEVPREDEVQAEAWRERAAAESTTEVGGLA